MNNKNNDIYNEIRTPSGTDYDPNVANSIRRRYGITVKDNKLIAEAQYTIRGMRYKVNSIFELKNASYSEDGLKRLMVQEIDKVS